MQNTWEIICVSLITEIVSFSIFSDIIINSLLIGYDFLIANQNGDQLYVVYNDLWHVLYIAQAEIKVIIMNH